MDGLVKWFSQEKGYGFITGEDQQDYYCNVREVRGAELPQNGDGVRFEPALGKKGRMAKSVVITSKSVQEDNRQPKQMRIDDRVACLGCGKRIVPRLLFNYGRPYKSVCPFCGTTYKDFGPCFIATAVYGDRNAPEVIALRRFRDECLMPTALGRAFIRFYYWFSPPIAAFLVTKPALSSIMRQVLDMLVSRRV